MRDEVISRIIIVAYIDTVNAVIVTKLQRVATLANPTTDVFAVAISQCDSDFYTSVIPVRHVVGFDLHGGILLAALVDKRLTDSDGAVGRRVSFCVRCCVCCHVSDAAGIIEKTISRENTTERIRFSIGITSLFCCEVWMQPSCSVQPRKVTS